MEVVKKLVFNNLKRLEGVEIDFPQTGVIAIMGYNGIGKSTILHALCCLYQPDERIPLRQTNYKWSRFFIPHGEHRWVGSSLDAEFYDAEDTVRYRKDTTRWTPKYSRRPKRYVKFIGLGDYHPHLEQEKYHSLFRYQTSEMPVPIRNAMLKYANFILKRKYDHVGVATKSGGTLRRFLFVDTDIQGNGNTTRYTSFYMGGGEQKVFHVLESLLTAPRGSLIVIEELEVLLHELALRRLVQIIIKLAESRKLQVVFSTHWIGVGEYADKIGVRTLMASQGGLNCVNGFDANIKYDITGSRDVLNQIEVWVEDTLSRKVVQKIAAEESILKHIEVKIFGAASNAFSVASAFALNNETPGKIIVLDGDVFSTDNEKTDQIAKTLSGHGAGDKRAAAVSLIVDYAPTDPMNPETFIVQTAREAGRDNIENDWVKEYVSCIEEEQFLDEGKSIIYSLSQNLDRTIDEIEADFVAYASGRQCWNEYTRNIRARLLEIAREKGIRDGIQNA